MRLTEGCDRSWKQLHAPGSLSASLELSSALRPRPRSAPTGPPLQGGSSPRCSACRCEGYCPAQCLRDSEWPFKARASHSRVRVKSESHSRDLRADRAGVGRECCGRGWCWRGPGLASWPVLLIISSEVMRWAAQLGSNGLDFGLYLRPDPPSAPGRLAWGLAGTLVQPVPCLRGRGWGGRGGVCASPRHRSSGVARLLRAPKAVSDLRGRLCTLPFPQ